MARKPPKVKMIRPQIKAMDHRTVRPALRTFASRVAADPTLMFYSSPEWRRFRAAIIAERGPRCETCGTHTDRPIVDHVVEIKDGGEPLDPANCAVKCSSCHVRKTGQARAARLGLI